MTSIYYLAALGAAFCWASASMLLVTSPVTSILLSLSEKELELIVPIIIYKCDERNII